MVYISERQQHGLKNWYHLTADTERELFYFARRLQLDIHGGEYSKHGTQPHLDLSEHDRDLAIRYGARAQ